MLLFYTTTFVLRTISDGKDTDKEITDKEFTDSRVGYFTNNLPQFKNKFIHV